MNGHEACTSVPSETRPLLVVSQQQQKLGPVALGQPLRRQPPVRVAPPDVPSCLCELWHRVSGESGVEEVVGEEVARQHLGRINRVWRVTCIQRAGPAVCAGWYGGGAGPAQPHLRA